MVVYVDFMAIFPAERSLILCGDVQMDEQMDTNAVGRWIGER